MHVELHKITPNELIIIQILRTLKPYERIEIVADKSGKMDWYIVVRSEKMLLSDEEPKHGLLRSQSPGLQ